MFDRWFVLVPLFAVIGVAFVRGECRDYRVGMAPSTLYDDLKCIPKYASGQDDCIEEYDCSHIYNRPKSSCHFKGKIFKIGEQIDNEELTGVWDRDCSCKEGSEFGCPQLMDGCAEDWVGGYPKPNCYLKYELNQYCAAGEICPPFDDNAKCVVKGVEYKQGNKFGHPDKKCVECVCDKGFDGKLEAPFCQQVNCTAELKNSKAIDAFCAPYYKDGHRGCCPDAWICPSENTVHHPNPLPTPLDNLKLSCKYGDKSMKVGDYSVQTDSKLGEVTCECAVPPFPYCTTYIKDDNVYD